MQRNWYGRGLAMEKTWEERMRLLASIAAGVALYLMIALPAGYTLLLTVKDYRPEQGIWASSFAGLDAYRSFFTQSGIWSSIGMTLLSGLLTGLFSCALITGGFYGLMGINDARIRYALAGLTFLPWILPSSTVFAGLYGMLPQASPSSFAMLILSAAGCSALAVPFILMGLLVLHQTKGNLGVTAILLAGFGLGWYAGALRNTPVNSESITNFAGQMGYSVSAVSGLFRSGIAKLGLLGLLPLVNVLFQGAVLPSEQEKRIFSKQPVYMLLLSAPAIILSILCVVLPLVSASGRITLTDGLTGLNYLASYLRLLSPLPGLVLGGMLAYLLTNRNLLDKILITMGVIFALSQTSGIATQSIFRIATNTWGTPLPPLDFHWSAIAGFAAMAFCYPYWEKRNCDNILTRGICLAVSLLLLIGLFHVSDISSSYFFASSDTGFIPISGLASLSGNGQALYLIPGIINLLITAAGIALLANAMYRIEVLSSLKG